VCVSTDHHSEVLVSHPEGRATIAALNSDLCILNTSGFGLDQPAEATSRPRPRSRHIWSKVGFARQLRLADHTGRQRHFLIGWKRVLHSPITRGRAFAVPATPATSIAAGRCNTTATGNETWMVCWPKTAFCLTFWRSWTSRAGGAIRHDRRDQRRCRTSAKNGAWSLIPDRCPSS
jgi:hypothetical protein